MYFHRAGESAGVAVNENPNRRRSVPVFAILFAIFGLAAGPALSEADGPRLARPEPRLRTGPAYPRLPGQMRLSPVSQDPSSGVFGSDSLGPDAAPFSDLPAVEVDLQAAMPRASAYDLYPVAFGRSDGRVCVLALDNFRLQSIRSTDGGKNFATPTIVAGGTGQPDVVAFAGALSSGAKLYVAFIVADPGGGLGLRFTRSVDMGLTWTAPTTLVGPADASYGVFDVAIAAGSGDRVAVTYLGGGGTDPWVRASADAGTTWNAAVRADGGVPAGAYPARDPDIDLDATGNVYVAYAQDRDGTAKIWTARSLNAGVSFQAEVTLGSLSPAGVGAPEVEVTNDGKVLIGFWDGDGADFIKVYRSTNQGAGYTLVLNQDLANDSDIPTLGPLIYVSPGTSVILAGYLDDIGTLRLNRTPDHGLTWQAPQTITTTAVSSSSWSGIPSFGFARTTGGNWLIAWVDARDDSYAEQKSDIYLRRSGTGGTSWDAEKRVDVGSSAGSSQSGPLSMTDALSNDVFLVYGDARNDQLSFNLYSNRSLSSPINFTVDKRIDTDSENNDPQAFSDVSVAHDGGSRIYVAFSAIGTGPSSDIYVTSSTNGGYTFGTPIRVGSTPAGQRISGAPVVAASSDGRVYLAWTSDSGTAREVRFNRSSNFGQTWQASDQVLGSFPAVPGNYAYLGIPGIQLIAQPGGTMYLAWATPDDVYLTRSFDSGATLDTRDVDQDTIGYNHYPALCANGNRLVLVFVAPDNAIEWYSVWGTTSDNRGDSWSSRVQLRPEGVGFDAYYPAVACDGGTGAVAVFSDNRSGRYSVRAARFNGTSWQADTAVPGPTDAGNVYPQVAYANSVTAVTVWEAEYGNAVYTSRSTNGGSTFGTQTRLDSSPSRPDFELALPNVVSDRAGNVWISWIDESAGRGSILVRNSTNYGASYDAARRIDSKTPQGGYVNRYFFNTRSAASSGTGYFAWAGERAATVNTVLFSAWDADDLDRDQSPLGVDCNDLDASVTRAPLEVAGVALARIGSTAQLSWTSQDSTAGSGTSYDVVTGDTQTLRNTKNYSGASCLVGQHPDTPYTDGRTGPGPGASYYYLVRARNSCGTASFGNANVSPDPRDGLDSSSPCP